MTLALVVEFFAGVINCGLNGAAAFGFAVASTRGGVYFSTGGAAG
jgi:hypothetical protein